MIFNTDQDSLFTSEEFISTLQQHPTVQISMDGKERRMDNVMIERLWRSLKYDGIYLHAFETGSELRQGLKHWINFNNTRWPHSKLDDNPPMRHIAPPPAGTVTQDLLSKWRHNHEGFPPYFRREHDRK